LKMLFTIPN
ncbi:hypothetical protein D046_3162B, partial [Vibrio parahaemolyticus V-223/04]